MNQRILIQHTRFSIRKHWPWLMVTSMICVIMALVYFTRNWRTQNLVNHFEFQLSTASETEVPGIIDQIASFENQGIPVLVRAIGSDRQAVSQHARRKLRKLFSQWESLPADIATEKIVILAQSLAKQVDQFGPTARVEATDFADRILLLRTDQRVVPRIEVIRYCNDIFDRVSPPATDPNRLQQQTSTPLESSEQSSSKNIKPISSLGPLPELPGGGIPVEPIKDPLLLATKPDLKQPNLIHEPTGAAPIPGLPQKPLKEPNVFYPNILKRPKSTTSDLNRLRPSPSSKSKENDNNSNKNRSDTNQSQQPILSDNGKIAYAEMIIQSQSSDRKEAFAAASQLRQVGFDQYRLAIGWEMRHPRPKTQLTLLRQATNADARIRQRLARILPRAEGMEIWPWMIWLSMDADREVRREAISRMNKIDHAEVQKRLQDIATGDSDEDIQIMAKRILKNQSQKRSQ